MEKATYALFAVALIAFMLIVPDLVETLPFISALCWMAAGFAVLLLIVKGVNKFMPEEK